MTRRPTTSMMATKAATLPRVSRSGRPSVMKSAPDWPFRMPASGGSSTSARTIARSSTISQPTAMRPRSVSIRRRSCSARSSTTVEATESASPNTSPAPNVQPKRVRQRHAEQRRHGDLGDRAGDRDGADRQQVLQREMQADAEHQQDDADFGELVGDAAGRRRSRA